MERDHVDLILEQWSGQRPDLDPSPMGVIARLFRLTRVLERKIDEVFSEFGLIQSGFTVLAALRRAGPPHQLSPSKLHDSLLVSSGAMTNRIDRLEARGLVERVTHPNDRRSVLVALTDEGRTLVDEAVEAVITAEVIMLRTLTSDEQITLTALLRKLSIQHEPSWKGGGTRGNG